MQNIYSKYIQEFGARIIERYGIPATTQDLLKMWDGVVESGSVVVNFQTVAETNKPPKIERVNTACPDQAVCSKILSSGANKGKECGKKCISPSIMCTKHTTNTSSDKDRSVDEKMCVSILTSGLNKGKECGKKCVDGTDTCLAHSKKTCVSKPKTAYKLIVKARENGLLVAINQTPGGSFFVFDNKKDRLICGKITPEETVIGLDESDIKFCNDNNLKMAPVITRKEDIEDILDEVQEA